VLILLILFILAFVIFLKTVTIFAGAAIIGTIIVIAIIRAIWRTPAGDKMREALARLGKAFIEHPMAFILGFALFAFIVLQISAWIAP